METEQQNPEFSGSFSNNFGYNGDSIIRIRLDTQQLLSQLEYFLKGQEIRYEADPQTQLTVEKVVQVGEQLANSKGIHSILSFVQATINAQVVQGNYDWDIWREEVAWCREQLATDVFVNHDEWGVSPQNIGLICNVVMNTIKPFLTRLVNNEERKSYANFQEMRTIQSPQKTGLLSKLGIG